MVLLVRAVLTVPQVPQEILEPQELVGILEQVELRVLMALPEQVVQE